MLRVDLGQLDREGTVVVEASLPEDDALWEGTALRWAGAVDVRLRASFAGTGEVVARGDVRGHLKQECTRCLRPLQTEFETELTMVFVSAGPEVEDDGGGYAFEPTGAELDLGEAVREEVLLASNLYVVCDPKCRGLCPKCGTELNEASCDCTEDGDDPRWAALRELKSE